MTTTVAENVKKLREKRGITIYQLSKETDIPCSTLLRIERGDHKKPRLVNIQALADYFDVNVQDIDSTRDIYEKVTTFTRSANRKVLLVEPGQLAVDDFDKNIDLGSTLLPAPAFKDINANDVVAIIAKGSANEPVISDGDILYIKPFKPEDCPADGSFVLAIPQEKDEKVNEPIVRRYVAGDHGVNWLRVNNPHWAGQSVMECKEVLGSVVALARRL